MDNLEKGSWIINTIKHTTGVRTDTVELNDLEVTERAGKSGILLGKLLVDKQEIITGKKLSVFARTANISPDAVKTYAEILKNFGQVDFKLDKFGNVSELEIYCLTTEDAIKTVSDIFEYYEPDEIERGNLESLKTTFEFPASREELTQALTSRKGISEENVNEILALESAFSLIKKERIENSDIYYNEYAFAGDGSKIAKAIASLPESQRNDVNFVMEQVKQSQGFLADNLTDKINPNIISMMEGVGLLDGITVNSDFGKAVFYTTPQLIGPGIGSWKISTDVFNHAKLLLSSLRYGEYKSVSSRGAIYTSSKMMNIVNKLLRGEWVGPCTAIGEDYKLLELDGVISVQPYNGMYKMKLRQFEVGRLVKQMLEYNMVVNDSVNEIDVFNNLPTGYIAPEERRKVIKDDITVPVKNIQEKFIASIRTGGIF